RFCTGKVYHSANFSCSDFHDQNAAMMGIKLDKLLLQFRVCYILDTEVQGCKHIMTVYRFDGFPKIDRFPLTGVYALFQPCAVGTGQVFGKCSFQTGLVLTVIHSNCSGPNFRSCQFPFKFTVYNESTPVFAPAEDRKLTYTVVLIEIQTLHQCIILVFLFALLIKALTVNISRLAEHNVQGVCKSAYIIAVYTVANNLEVNINIIAHYRGRQYGPVCGVEISTCRFQFGFPIVFTDIILFNGLYISILQNDYPYKEKHKHKKCYQCKKVAPS